MKDLKDYLHLYLGCQIRHYKNEDIASGVLVGVTQSEVEPDKWIAIIDVGGDVFMELYVEETVLRLRPLSSITDEERVQRGREVTRYGGAFIEAEYHRWMLSKGFDLFGLIEAGLAIDATTLKT